MPERIAANPWYVYGGGFVALALLVCSVVFFGTASKDFSVTRVGDTQTYTDMRYGFRFSYPASFQLLPPFFDSSLNDISLSDVEREEVFQRDQQKWKKEFEKINQGVVRGEGDGINEILVTSYAATDFPTQAQEEENCKEEQRLNPQLSPEEVCALPSITQEDIIEEETAIRTGAIGDEVSTVYKGFPKGTIIETKGVRGIRGLWFSPDTGDYIASFTTYTKAEERISIEIWLAQSVTTSEGRSAYDTDWRAVAENDPRNRVLDEIISSFEFLE